MIVSVCHRYCIRFRDCWWLITSNQEPRLEKGKVSEKDEWATTPSPGSQPCTLWKCSIFAFRHLARSKILVQAYLSTPHSYILFPNFLQHDAVSGRTGFQSAVRAIECSPAANGSDVLTDCVLGPRRSTFDATHLCRN